MARNGGPAGFAVSVTLGAATGRAPPRHRLRAAGPDGRPRRLCRIDGRRAPSPVAFAEYLRVVWLTPGPRRPVPRARPATAAASSTGSSSPSMPATAPASTALERALRSRNRLLEERPDDGRWLDAVEREVAELGVAVALARRETVERLDRADRARPATTPRPFPGPALRAGGRRSTTSSAVWPAVEAEDRFRAALRQGRAPRPRRRAHPRRPADHATSWSATAPRTCRPRPPRPASRRRC